MNSRFIPSRNWLRAVAIVIGILMIVAAIAVGLVHGFSPPKLLIGLSGLLILVAVKSGQRFVGLYKSAAIILLNTLALLVFLEIAATAILRFWPSSDEGPDPTATYYGNQVWGAGYQGEIGNALESAYSPFVVWKTKPYQGQYVNVDKDGNRVTTGARCEKDSFTVFVFGGSTVWGDGVPDWGTVPSYLQGALGGTLKRPLCVKNFGQPAWVSTQGVIELLKHLQAGEAPNLVVFYDGINDVGMAAEEGVAGGHESISSIGGRLKKNTTSHLFIQLLIRMKTFELLEKPFPSLSSLRSWNSNYREATYNTEVLGGAITRAYLANYRTVKAMANDFGFDYVFFWQPNLFYEQKPLTEEEKQIAEALKDDRARINELLKVVYPQVRAATKDHDHLFYIADIFNTTTERVYLNDAHLTPVGNEKVAKRLMDLLVEGDRFSQDRKQPSQ